MMETGFFLCFYFYCGQRYFRESEGRIVKDLRKSTKGIDVDLSIPLKVVFVSHILAWPLCLIADVILFLWKPINK